MLGIDRRALRVIWTLFLAALVLSIVYYIRATILLLAVSVFFAYMLSPIVGLVERFIRKRRGLALAVVYIAFVGLLVLLGFELIPRFASQAMSLVTRLPALVTSGTVANLPLPQWLKPLHDQILSALDNEAQSLQTSVVPFLQKAGTQILSGIGAILPIILVPIFAFFFLKDGRSILDSFLRLFENTQRRRTVKLILDDVHMVLRNYIRALALLAIASFACWFVFLSLMHYSYELLLAGIAGSLEFIPVIGPAAALLIIVVVTLVTGSGSVLWIIVFSVPVMAIVRVIYSNLRKSYLRANLARDAEVTSTPDYPPSTSSQTPAYTSLSPPPAHPIPPAA